jgi:hypothetical protein
LRPALPLSKSNIGDDESCSLVNSHFAFFPIFKKCQKYFSHIVLEYFQMLFSWKIKNWT